MTCGISRPSLAVLFDRVVGRFSSQVLGGSPVIPESNEWYVSALLAGMQDQMWSVIDQQWKEADPRTACCDNLVRIAGADGVYPDGGRAAEGYGIFKGTAGARIPRTMRVIVAGAEYRTVGTPPAYMPATGSVALRLRSDRIGAAGNGSANQDLTGQLGAEVDGIDSTVTIAGGTFCGGTDPETCEVFRARYLDRRAYRPQSRKKDVERIILDWPCVTRVCERGGACCSDDCETTCGCSGALNYYVFFDGTFENGLATQSVIDDMNDAIFGTPAGHGEGLVDIGVCGRLYTATAVPMAVRIGGLDCLAQAKREAIKAAVDGLFRSFCPSGIVEIAAVDAVVRQIAGATVSADIVFEPTGTTNYAITRCGDIELDCDHQATLTETYFVGPTGARVS